MTPGFRPLSRLLAPAAFVLALAGAGSTAAAEPLSEQQLEQEREACVAHLEQQVKAPAEVCDCMVEGLAEQLELESYAALTRLVHQETESEAAAAARETARQIVAGCLEG